MLSLSLSLKLDLNFLGCLQQGLPFGVGKCTIGKRRQTGNHRHFYRVSNKVGKSGVPKQESLAPAAAGKPVAIVALVPDPATQGTYSCPPIDPLPDLVPTRWFRCLQGATGGKQEAALQGRTPVTDGLLAA